MNATKDENGNARRAEINSAPTGETATAAVGAGFTPARPHCQMIRYVTDKEQPIDWEEAACVIERAPLGKRRRNPEQLRRAFAASYAVVYAFDDDRLIGLTRALCDGEYQAAVYDVVLLPEYQGRGIGRELVQRCLDQLPVDNVILYAVRGREGFYKRCGFRKMLTAMAILNPLISDPASGYLE